MEVVQGAEHVVEVEPDEVFGDHQLEVVEGAE